MKPTVDLTSDRMFPDKAKRKLPYWISDEDSEYSKINAIFNDTINRVPWEFRIFNWIASDSDFREKDPLVGTPEDYRRNEEVAHANSFDYCDRCGCKIVTPWRWDRSLCEECNIAIFTDLHYKKVPWEDEENNWAIMDGRRIWIE